VRILWIKTELLHPVDKGGRIRTYQMLKALARAHAVTYLTLDDGTAAPDAAARAREYSTELVVVPFQAPAKGTARFFADLASNLVSPLPYVIARYHSSGLAAQVSALAPHQDLIVCDFLSPSASVSDHIARAAVLFQHNVEAMIWERHASVPQNPLRRAYMRLQWRRMQRFEARTCARFRRVIAVSEQDAELFRTHYGIASATAVPTGVDTEYFAPAPQPSLDSQELVFVGSMDWMPNDDGIRWFTESVFPLIRRRAPDATLTVVGRSPSAEMKRMATRIAGVQVTGSVADVRPYLHRAAVSVVPLRIGGGTRLKIFEAMAAGAPVVSTTIGAEGLPVQDGEHLLIADSPEEQADAIVQLLRDRRSALAMADRARHYVRANCSWDAVAQQFLKSCSDTESSE
jgi:sugar transferase (PEP-CTERM/EpsH1 system associated)